MTFKLPDLSGGKTMTDVLAASFQAELMAERASEMGRTGAKVKAALDILAATPADADPALREDRLADAAEAVWTYFIQREISGYRQHRDAIEFYQIPRAVLLRLGVVRRKTG